ncbi:MAG: HAD family hydrolase [Deltaproteobacteria bacterium]|nr:HAD family hydrolase [Deltaproteobacteria bacterium]
MSKLRAIVFDFDGVVLESADVKTDAFMALYESYGPEIVRQVREHHLQNMGISRFKKFTWIAEHLLGTTLTEAELVELGERFSALALERVLAAPFVPGADIALAELSAQYPLFVASGTPHEELTMIVERRGLAPRFREVHGTPVEKPTILRDVMSRFSFDCTEVLFIGDGMSDYKAARETGVEFLARDTDALRDEWTRLGTRRAPDLTTLMERVQTW